MSSERRAVTGYADRRPRSSAAFPATFVALAVALVTRDLQAGDGAGNRASNTELAEKTQNPVADLISMPFENNFNFNSGTGKATLYDLNFQPIIPFHLSRDWNLITRTIVPLINEPSLSLPDASSSAFGLGDINPSFFFSPASYGAFTWGAGPTFTLPTATKSQLGSHQYSIGPTAAGLLIEGPVLAGLLINNQWSVGGWGSRRVNQMLLEPFGYYNFDEGWHLSSELIMMSNWAARPRERWTVPVGGGFGKLFRLVDLPIDTNLQAYYNVERSTNAADWQLRFRMTVLLPSE